VLPEDPLGEHRPGTNLEAQARWRAAGHSVGASLYLLGKDNHSHRSDGSDPTVTVALHPNPT